MHECVYASCILFRHFAKELIDLVWRLLPKMLILGLLAKKSDLGNLIAKMIDFRRLSPKWLILRLLAKKVIQAIVAKN